MKRSYIFFGLSALLVGLLFSCVGNKKINPQEYLGTYMGELPCADCPGILTYVTLYADSTAAVTQFYYDSDNTSSTDYGRWIFEDGIFIVQTEWGKLYYKAEPDMTLLQTDSNGNVIPELRERYRLRKNEPMTVNDFEGKYRQEVFTDNGCPLVMTIAPATDDAVTVVITSATPDSCSFAGIGNIVNNQIEVPLASLIADSEAVMVIRPVANGVLNLFTSRFDDYTVLAGFGKEGISLAGDYVRM